MYFQSTSSTSAAICAELATILTELGLPHVIRSDNGPCYNSKEFQQFLQCYNITYHTSSPHHPRSNGFVERMVGVAKKLMDKAGKEGKLWISDLCEYRVTPQSGSIASPLQLITQRTPREKDLPHLPSTLGAQEMYQTHQELIRRQQNKPEKSYIELTLGTPVWVQHKQNTSWEPATVVSQCTTNSDCIMQENGTEQPKVYRRTRSMLKIRCTMTEVEQTGYRNSQSTESEKTEFHTPAIPNTVRNCVEENSLENVSPDLVQLTVPTPDTYLQASAASFDSKSEEREEIADTPVPALEMVEEPGTYTPGSRKSTRKNFESQIHLYLHWRWPRNQVLILQDPDSQQERTLESQPVHLVIFICKDTSASGTVDYQFKMLNFELYVLYSRAELAIFNSNCNRHWLLLTFYVFQDHRTSEYIYIWYCIQP